MLFRETILIFSWREEIKLQNNSVWKGCSNLDLPEHEDGIVY